MSITGIHGSCGGPAARKITPECQPQEKSIEQQAIELCWQIEKCGASQELTKASQQASNLYLHLAHSGVFVPFVPGALAHHKPRHPQYGRLPDQPTAPEPVKEEGAPTPAGETPRTDARIGLDADGDPVVTADFARQLEQELTEALNKLHEWEITVPGSTIIGLNRELAAAKREVEEARKLFKDGGVNWPALNALINRNNEINEELRTENVRLRAQLTALPSKPEATATEWAEKQALSDAVFAIQEWFGGSHEDHSNAEVAKIITAYASSLLRHHAAQQGGEDTRRLDWLSAQRRIDYCTGYWKPSDPRTLRAAIDAAMQQEASK